MDDMRTTVLFALALGLAGCAAPPAPASRPPSEPFRAGEVALLAEDYPAAAAAFGQALAQAGDDDAAAARAAYWLGVCRRAQGDADGARAAFTRALAAADPAAGARARLQLGDLAWEAQAWREAREMYSGAARDLAALTTEELLHARRRGAQASIRTCEWSDGQSRISTWGPAAEPPEWTLVRRVAAGGQFACALGPVPAIEAERLLEQLHDAGRQAQAWSIGPQTWVAARPANRRKRRAGERSAFRRRRSRRRGTPARRDGYTDRTHGGTGPMRNSRPTIIGLLAAAALAGGSLWLAAGAQAQDKAVGGAKRTATVTFLDTTGKTHTVTEGRMFAEEVGLLSVSLEPAKAFAFENGAATLRIPVRSILEIQFSEEKDGQWTKVKVTDIDKRVVTGTAIDTDTNEIRGQDIESVHTEVRLKLNSVKRITFTQPSGARACSKCRRIYQDPAWRFCPHDAQKLPAPGK
jgi:hypothetical protein